MNQPRSIVIAANPKSGARSGLTSAQSLRTRLEQAGFHAELHTDLTTMAARVSELHAQKELRAVVAAGGDGTASVVIGRVPRDVPIALFPLGSENLLAKYFGIDGDLEATVARIQSGTTHALDLFKVNGTLSLLMTSVGFDAEVVRIVHQSRTSHITRWRYRWAILQALLSYRWPSFQVELLDREHQWYSVGQFDWLFAFNVPKYAAGISLIEDASCNDGLLEVGAFEGGGLFRGLSHYGRAVRGQLASTKSWHRWQSSGVRITPKIAQPWDPVASYQYDGDWGGAIPLEIVWTGQTAPLLVNAPQT